MKSTLALIAALAGSALAGGVTGKVSPKGSAPAGCSASYSGNFEVTVVDVKNAKRDFALAERDACSGDGILVVSLADGVLTDAKSRTGYIASNYQFQFDAPPQAGAIYTAGFSACSNGSLAFGSSAVFYKCQSGSFYNLYDRSWASQCAPVEIAILPCGAGSGTGQQKPDGQVVGTTVVATTIVSALADGQPQVITTKLPVPLCQINDGQLQAHTTPCASITAKPTSSAAPVSQYSDGQIQVTPPSGAGSPAPKTTAAGAPPPAASGSASASAGTTLSPSTTASSKAASSTASSSAPAASTSAKTTTNSAGRIEMGSVAALVVGIIGAVFFL